MRSPRCALTVAIAMSLWSSPAVTALEILELEVTDDAPAFFPGAGNGDGILSPDEHVGIRIVTRAASALPEGAVLRLRCAPLLLTMSGDLTGTTSDGHTSVGTSPVYITASVRDLGDQVYEADYAPVFRPIVANADPGNYTLQVAAVRRKDNRFWEVLDEGAVSLEIGGEDTSGPRVGGFHNRLGGLEPLMYTRMESRGMVLKGSAVRFRVSLLDASGVSAAHAQFVDLATGQVVDTTPLVAADPAQSDGVWHYTGSWPVSHEAHMSVGIEATDPLGHRRLSPDVLEFTSAPFRKTAPILVSGWDDGALLDALDRTRLWHDKWRTSLRTRDPVAWRQFRDTDEAVVLLSVSNGEEETALAEHLRGGGKALIALGFGCRSGIVTGIESNVLRNHIYSTLEEGDFPGDPLSANLYGAYGAGAFEALELRLSEPPRHVMRPTASGIRPLIEDEFGQIQAAEIADDESRLIYLNFDLAHLADDQAAAVLEAALTELLGSAPRTAPETAIADQPVLPVAAELYPSYPNPFNAVTNIPFVLARGDRAALTIRDVLGRHVWAQTRTDLAPGRHIWQWNGTDGEGNGVTSGAYLYELRTGGSVQIRKLMLLE